MLLRRSIGRVLIVLILVMGASILVLFLTCKNVTMDEAGRAWIRDVYLYPKPQQLIDLNVEYLINNDVCGKVKIFLLILVTSHPGDSQFRSTLRKEFNRSVLNQLGIRRVFLLAHVDSKSVQKKYPKVSQKEILAENELNHDIVQGNFTENYRNLTYKHLMGLDWSRRFCPQAAFVLKQDDDVFVDPYGLRQHLQNTSLGTRLRSTNSIFGKLLLNKTVLRDTNSKWYVTQNEYAGTTYPDFVSGWAYVTTPKVITTLLNAGQRMPYFWIDDAHVTGTLRNLTGATIIDASLNFATHADYLECCLSEGRKSKLWCDFIIGPDESSKPLLRTKLLSLSRACYESQTCAMRQKSNSLSKHCVHTRTLRKKSVALPGSQGKAYWESVALYISRQ